MGQNPLGVGRTAPTIERGRRCQNCVHYNSGPMATSHYKALRTRDMEAAAAKVLSNESVSAAMLGQRIGDENSTPSRDKNTTQDRFDALGLNYDLGDRLINSGQLGICLIDAAEGDFIHFAHLCDKWTERVKPDESEKHDELGAEARERLYGSDK